MSSPLISIGRGEIRMEALVALRESLLDTIEGEPSIDPVLGLASQLRARGWELVPTKLLMELLEDGGQG